MPAWITTDRITVTPAALEALHTAAMNPDSLIERFRARDWGADDEYSRSLGNFCAEKGLAVISWYTLAGGPDIAVVAPSDRSEIVVCLRSEHGPQAVDVQEGYAAWSNYYDEEFNQLILIEQPLVDRLLGEARPVTVLDAAAGTGRHALRLARQGSRTVALDASRPMLEVGRARAAAEQLPLSFLLAGLQGQLPFRDGTFDLVLCALVFCHLPDIELSCNEFFRVARPGGRFLLTDFHPDAVDSGWHTDTWSGLDVYRLPTVAHGRAGYLAAVERAGFAIRSVHDVPISSIPEEASHAGLTQKWGSMNFCLVVDAEKPQAI